MIYRYFSLVLFFSDHSRERTEKAEHGAWIMIGSVTQGIGCVYSTIFLWTSRRERMPPPKHRGRNSEFDWFATI